MAISKSERSFNEKMNKKFKTSTLIHPRKTKIQEPSPFKILSLLKIIDYDVIYVITLKSYTYDYKHKYYKYKIVYDKFSKEKPKCNEESKYNIWYSFNYPTLESYLDSGSISSIELLNRKTEVIEKNDYVKLLLTR